MYAGVDEAGRGPFIGPLVVAAVAAADPQLLLRLGVRDSKRLSRSRRRELNEKIHSVADVAIRIISVEELNVRLPKENLNRVTLAAFRDVLNSLRPQRAVVDICGRDGDAWALSVREGLSFECTVHSEARADAIFPQVSAASIVAKEERERCLAEIHHAYGYCGSGYPSDSRSIEFVSAWVEDHGALPPFVRHTWATVKRWR